MQIFFKSLILTGMLCLAALAGAQSKLLVSGEIISAQLNPAKTLMALSTVDSIFILDLGTLKIRQRRGSAGHIFYVESIPAVNDDAVFLRMRKYSYPFYDGLSKRAMLEGSRMEFLEYPDDSLVMWKVAANTLKGIMPGNNRFAPGHFGECSMVAYNQVFSYQNSGTTYWSSIACNLTAFDSNRSYQQNLNMSCKSILVSPDDKLYAATFNSLKQKNIFQIKDLHSHEVLIEIDGMEKLPDDICFSADGKFCAVALRDPEGNVLVRIYSMAAFKLAGVLTYKTQKVNEKLTRLDFVRGNSQVAFLLDREWHALELNSGKEIETHGLLISLDWYSDAWCVEEKLVCIYPDKEMGLPNWKNTWIEKSSLEDLKTFTRREQAEVSRLDTPGLKYLMINSSIANLGGYKGSEIKFDRGRNYFSIGQGNRIEYWETSSHKKIWEKQFDQTVKVFPGNLPGHLFVIEENPNGHRLHFLNIGQNKMSSSDVIDRDHAGIDLKDCNCEIESDSSWACADGSSKIWKFREGSFDAELIYTLKNEASADRVFVDNNNAIYTYGNSLDENHVMYLKDGDQKEIYSGRTGLQVAGRKNLYCFWEYKATAFNFVNSGERSMLQVDGAIHQVDIGADNNILVYYEKDQKYYLDKWMGKKLIFSKKYGSYGDYYFQLGSDEILGWKEEEGFHSLLDTLNTALNWTIRRPLGYLQNFDISKNGNYITYGNALVDMRAAAVMDVGVYSGIRLLNDTKYPERLEIYSDNYTDKPGFGIMKIRGIGDTVFSKSWIPIPKNGFLYANDELVVSSDHKWALSYTKDNMYYHESTPVIIWNLVDMTGEALLKNGVPVYAASFTEGILKIGSSERSYSWDSRTGKLSSQKNPTVFDPVNVWTQEGITGYAIGNHEIALMEKRGEGWEKKRSYYGRDELNRMHVYAPGKIIVAGSKSGIIYLWDEQGSGSPMLSIKAHSTPVERLEMHGKYLYSASGNGEIAIFDLDKRKLLLTLIFLQKGKEIKYLMITPEGYYRMDPDLVKYVHFARQGRVFPMGSTDLEYNRPDKVYEAIGKSSAVFMDDLRKSWKLRIQRQGALSGKMGPAAILSLRQGFEPPTLTTTREYTLNLHFSDSFMPIRKLFVWVNGVPVGHSSGQFIPNGKLEMDLEKNILLNSGENHVFAVAENSLGVSSSELSFDIFYKPEISVQPKVFYLGVGVSNYSDSNWNLKYSGNDVRDISERLGYYGNTEVLDTLIDNRASRQNILDIKKKLKGTTVDDVVIISFSGHGLKHKDSGFYFAPWDMDFDTPWKRGISMQEIANLLEDIPARKRLLMLDACHSGEDLAFDYTGKLATGVSENKPRGGTSERLLDTAAAAGSKSLTLLKEMFTDLNAGNGAYMISASASSEYAFEGAKWKNGVFTYSFLKHFGVRDGLITVKDLRNGIYKDVTELTGGKQNPTSRLENGYWNWEIKLVPKRR